MSVKLVVRVMDAAHQLLGWAQVPGEMHGDACLRVSGTHPLVIDREGVPAWITVTWADLGVTIRGPAPAHPVQVGQIITLQWKNEPLMTFPTDPGPLPGVTVRGPVLVSPPMGFVGAKAGES